MHSLLNKSWKIKTPYENVPLLHRICAHRDLDPEAELTEFHSPWLMKGMRVAVERVGKAIKDQERIMIFGDYDVDGITGASVLYMGLKELGANVSVRLPHRERDGYGLNTRVLDECKTLGVSLLITVDCGVSNVKEVDHGRNLGIDIIICDHHTIPPILPKAIAILNPHQLDCAYPEKYLCGTAVGYKLLCGLFEHLHLTPHDKLQTLLDLVSLATIADCMPLKGENRLIVKRGLIQFGNTQHRGLRKLAESFHFPSAISSYHMAFQIAPCINAAGRIEDPMTAFKMMIGDTEKAVELRQMNVERQELVKVALEQAMTEVEHHQKENPLLFVHSSAWSPGIIGLLAGRLCEKYYKPSICLTLNGGKYTASCRSIPEINIVEQLRLHEDLFLGYGGHAQAAGFSVTPENLEKLEKTLQKSIGDWVKKNPIDPHLKLDTEITAEEMTLESIETMKTLEPFGMGNPTPKFLFKNARIRSLRPVGQDKTHLQFGFAQGSRLFKGIGFQLAEYLPVLKQWETVDIACQLQKNEFRGEISVDLQVLDVRKTCD